MYLEDDCRQGGLVVAVLICLRLRLFLPVFLICFQSFPQPACDVRLLEAKPVLDSGNQHEITLIVLKWIIFHSSL